MACAQAYTRKCKFAFITTRKLLSMKVIETMSAVMGKTFVPAEEREKKV